MARSAAQLRRLGLVRRVASDADRTESLTAKFENLTPAQAQQFKRLFAWMNQLGNFGCSREFKVFYDGDGAARCKISVDGQQLKVEKDDPGGGHDYEHLSFGFD